MPQTNVLADWKLTYPNDAPRMKPSAYLGTVTRTSTAGSWAGNVATLTVPSTTDYVGTVYTMVMAGFTPAGYNGTFQGTIASATTITYPLTTNPGGAVTVQGTVTYQAMVPVNMSTTLPGNAVPNTMAVEEGHVLTAEELIAAAYAPVQQAKEEVEDTSEEEVEDTEEEDDEEDDTRSRRGRGRRR
jgi:hypothetical protein